MRNLKQRILLSVLHAFWMVLLIFILQKLPVILNYEINLTQDLWQTEFYARLGNVQNNDKYTKKFFFINTSRSFEIDEKVRDGIANLRTDRKQLLSILKTLNESKQSFDVIFLDIFIPETKAETETEIQLQKIISELKKNKKIVTVSNVVNFYEPLSNLPPLIKSIRFHSNDYTLYEENAFGDSLSGPAYYPLTNSDAFFKFNYNISIGNKMRKQAPLLLYECISNETAEAPFMFDLFYGYKDKAGLYQNIYIPKIILNNGDLHYYKTDLFTQNTEFLSELVNDEEFLKDKLNREPGKIIFIGDMLFADVHYAKGTRISGPVLVANTLIALLEANNRISYLYLIFLIIAFSIVSYFTFWPKILERESKRKIRFPIFHSVYQYIIAKSNYLILLITSLIGIFVFNQYIFLFFNIIYVFLIGKLLKLLTKRKSKTTA